MHLQRYCKGIRIYFGTLRAKLDVNTTFEHEISEDCVG